MAPQSEPQGGNPAQMYSPYEASLASAHNQPTPTQNADGISQSIFTTSSTPQPSSYGFYPSSSSNYGSYPSGNPNQDPYADNMNNNHPAGLPPWLLVAVVVIPLIIVGVSAVALYLIIRARRRQREAAAAMPEMKDLTPTRPRDERAYIRPPSAEPPPTITVASSTPSGSEARSPTAAAPPTQRQSQPVILSTTMDQAYYTGLDTADHLSLSDARSQISQDPYDGDEPPPPYRPRSVPPISRDASVRTSHTQRTSSIARRNQSNDPSTQYLMSGARRSHDLRSPFEDPEDEDDAASAVSEVTIRPQRHAQQQDRLSVVSDLSYQDEPVVGRSSI